MRCVKCGNELHNSKCSQCGFEHRGATVCFLTEPKAEDIRLMSDFEIRDGVLVKYTGTAADVVIPEGIYKIRDFAFSYKKQIRSVVIPQGVGEIGDGAFSHCENMKYVSFPDTLKTIHCAAFSDTGLQEVVLPEQLQSLGQYVFFRSKIEKIVIPSGIEEMDYAFSDCRQLREIEFRKGIKKIGRDSFIGCTALRVVKFPDGLEFIGACAFFGCEGLEEIVLPDTVALGISPFGKCDNLKRVIVSKKWVQQHLEGVWMFGERLVIKD